MRRDKDQRVKRVQREQGIPRRHCMVVFNRYPWAETRVQREAEALIAQGYEVDVICLQGQGEPPYEDYHSVQVFRLPARRRKGSLLKQFLNYLDFFVLAGVRLTRLHRRQPYDVVQVHNLPDFLVFCALIPKLDGVPIILDLHDLMPEFYAGRFGQIGGSLVASLVCWQERLACSFADHVITVSEHWRQALIERGIPSHKCSVVMNVADQSIFFPLEKARSRSSTDSAFRLVYHGTMVYRYGPDLAIQAIDQVRHEIPDIHLVLLGEGDYLPTLRQMVSELGLGRHVTFEEKRLAARLPEVILTADLGIVPYRNDIFTDGLLPTKLMEYAAMGLPSIAARTTAIEAYFGDTMVEFFEPGDVDGLARCIRTLHNSPSRLTELVQGSSMFNKRYNWRGISDEYIALVEGLGTRSREAGGVCL
jgi:glycosyltransferase involved in cell wall biosynthesis